MTLGSVLPSRHGRTQQFAQHRISSNDEKVCFNQDFVIGNAVFSFGDSL